jgi:hypothetical protein
MKTATRVEDHAEATLEVASPAAGELPALLEGPVRHAAMDSFTGTVVGDLVGIADHGCTPLVLFPGQRGSAAVAARTMVDVHGAHVGKQVVLLFEACDPAKPIIMGVLREAGEDSAAPAAGQVDVAADGQRLIVSARDQLVLRCGKASITLTKEGKVLIQGAFLSSRASGVNRITGGAVQIN